MLQTRTTLESSIISVLESPATLIFAIAMTTTALTTHHYLQRDIRHQDAFIFGAVAAGVIWGWLSELKGTSILLQVTPWCAFIGIAMSASSRIKKTRARVAEERSGSSQISKEPVMM